MPLKVLLVINLIIIQVIGFNVRTIRQRNDIINVTGIIKDTENRVNKNAYNESDSETANTCGGIYTLPQFLIESPNYPSFYPNELDCTFIFRGPYCPSNYTLQFLDFNLHETKGCIEDRLMIGTKETLCGVENGIKMYYTKTGTLNLKFITAKFSSGRGFRILVSRSICIPLIDSQDDNRTTTTERVDIVYPSSALPHAYLPVGKEIPSFTKNHEGYPGVNVTRNINKSHDLNISDTINTCGGIYNEPQFLIETPNYPNNYSHDLNCLFIFKGPYCLTNYTLNFLDFNVKDSLGCVDDRLEIKYKDALCGIHIGKKNYTSKTGTLELNFITNSDMGARGFRILVTRTQCPILNKVDVTPKPQSLLPTYIYVSDPNNPDITHTITPNILTDQTTTTTPNNMFTMSTSQLPYPPADNYQPTTDKPGIQAPYAPTGIRPLGGEILYPSNSRTSTQLTSYLPTGFNPQVVKGQACCAATYSDKRFFLTSPGFPYSHHNPTECTFTIYRANPNVCRMRINFHYFWIGNQNINCKDGYLQIDGKLICGCHTGLNLVSPFDKHLGNTKVLRLKNLGVLRGQFNGFAIEIVQDECPKRYSPKDLSTSSFSYYNDQFNRITWPNSSGFYKADRTEIFEPIDLGYKPRVVKHVYFFESPDFNDNVDTNFNFNKRRDVEESTYFETTDLTSMYPQDNNNKCHMWGINQLSMLRKDHFWNRMPKCNEITNNPVMSSCKEYNFIKGYFQSPGYPHYYPNNLNICYRFSKQRGFCSIRLVILDFDLEDCLGCRNDYLLFSGKFRYCGHALSNTFTQFDVNNRNYEEIRFKTDGFNSGRGFRGVYEQIPCSGHILPPIPSTTHLPPPRPPATTATTTSTTTTTTTFKPPVTLPCIREISDDYFTIDIYDYGTNVCNFNVKKSSQDVCRLELSFVTFNFPCETEYLLVNNDKFCGELQQQMVNFNFNNDEIPIIYHRLHSQINPGYGLKLHLVGRQISKDCVKIPPAERILAVNPRIAKDRSSELKDESTINRNVSVYLKRKYKEVCGIVMSVNASYLKDSLCNVILNNKRNFDCNPLSENTVYVPYNETDKLELMFKNSEIVQDIEFKEVTCDNKFIV